MKQLIADIEYEQIKTLLPCGFYKDKKRPDNRLFIEGVLYVVKTGIPWRQLPVCN